MLGDLGVPSLVVNVGPCPVIWATDVSLTCAICVVSCYQHVRLWNMKVHHAYVMSSVCVCVCVCVKAHVGGSSGWGGMNLLAFRRLLDRCQDATNVSVAFFKMMEAHWPGERLLESGTRCRLANFTDCDFSWFSSVWRRMVLIVYNAVISVQNVSCTCCNNW